MKRYLSFLFLIFSFVLSGNTYITHAHYFIDSNGNGCPLGRMGDQLIAYSKAKWFSYKYNIPYLFREFPYSQHFALYELEPNKIGPYEKITEKAVPFTEDLIEQGIQNNLCYAVSYMYWSKAWEWNRDVGTWTDAIRDEGFLQHLRTMLTPNIEIPTLKRPEGIRTVAVHIRKGSYFDTVGFFSEQEFTLFPEEKPSSPSQVSSFMDIGEPYKFPPNQYYIDRIKQLAERFEYEPLHVVLFTDYHNPELLLSLLQKKVGLDMVTYSIASKVEFLPLGIAKAPGIQSSLHDLFMMTQCDCLIRSGSNFAQIAHLLGNYEVVYFPLDAVWYDNRLTFATIGCIERSE